MGNFFWEGRVEMYDENVLQQFKKFKAMIISSNIPPAVGD